MRVERSISVDRDVESVFDFVSDPSRYGDFFVGVTRWEPLSQKKRGIGARYRVLMQVGAIEAGGIVRVDVWDEPNTIEWEAEQGIRQRGSWNLAESGDSTDLTLAIEFDLSGGPVGALVERLAGRIVARNMWATLLAARRILEVESVSG